MIGDEVSVEAYSRLNDVPHGVLIRHLFSQEPRAGLWAAARATRVPDWTIARLGTLVMQEQPTAIARYRPLAIYAWGVAAARRHGAPDPSFAALIDGLLGDTLCHEQAEDARAGIGANATLLAMSVVGHVATAARIARAIELSGPTVDKLFALGLLGVPRFADVLVATMRSSNEALRLEALRAIYLMTGRMFVEGGEESMRDDGIGAVPDPGAAEAFFAGWRHRHDLARLHLGVALARDGDGPASSRLLNAILTGRPRQLGSLSLPGLFDGRARLGTAPFTIAPPTGRVDLVPLSRPATFHPDGLRRARPE
ncbi:MAG: hypothetical protein U0414_43445 [Polyangiaceae bacterium]